MSNYTFVFLTILVGMAIPIVVIVGGLIKGIVKSHHQHKLLELAQRERIVAIEKGVDPAKLPQITLPAEVSCESNKKNNGLYFEQKQLRRSQLLMIWGLIIAGFGLGFLPMFLMNGGLSPDDQGPFLIFLMIGIALMISSRVVKPDPEDVKREAKLREEAVLRGQTLDSDA